MYLVELKLKNLIDAETELAVLIVPSGIETWFVLREGFVLPVLIVPSGIETCEV